MNPKLIIENLISRAGYPPICRKGINKFATTTNIDVGPKTPIGSGAILRGEINIGPETRIRQNCRLVGNIDIASRTGVERNTEIIGDVNIGSYNAIAPKCVFRQKDHNIDRPAIQSWFYNEIIDSSLDFATKGPITLGNDVWIGTQAIILSGVEIGNGAIVGAGSVVTKDVEPYSVVAGNPARHVKWRYPEEVRKKLLDVAWWEWTDETIRSHRNFFETEIEDVSDIPDIY